MQVSGLTPPKPKTPQGGGRIKQLLEVQDSVFINILDQSRASVCLLDSTVEASIDCLSIIGISKLIRVWALKRVWTGLIHRQYL